MKALIDVNAALLLDPKYAEADLRKIEALKALGHDNEANIVDGNEK